MSLPPNLPSIAKAKLPVSYSTAKTALEKCERLDECKDWAKKAEALASYARQAGDDSLRKTAERIQARAIRRCGELLRSIRPSAGGRPEKLGSSPTQVSRSQAARDAGMSRNQKRDALRVAGIPATEFDAAVESDDPPTITRLLEEQRKPLVDLKGRDPEEFARSTEGQGQLRRLAEFAERVKPEIIARGAFPHELAAIRNRIDLLMPWLMALRIALEES